MTQKRTTFKQRIRKNDMKQRHQIGSGIRKRMGASRRVYNRFDAIDDGARPMELIVSEIAEGTAVPTQETTLDPRSLTDLLLRPVSSGALVGNGVTAATASSSPPMPSSKLSAGAIPLKRRPSHASAAMTSVPLAVEKVLPSQPLSSDDPLALPDTRIFEEEERQQRLAQELSARQKESKNQYHHKGQSYIFWERIGLHPALLRALRALHFTHPTPVQEEVLPNVLASHNGSVTEKPSGGDEVKDDKRKQAASTGANAGQDVVVSAETGSGKTLVFALPILQELLTRLDAEMPLNGPAVTASTMSDVISTSAAAAAAGGEASPKNPGLDDTAARVARKAAHQQRVMHSLIISPTRELALQIDVAIRQLTTFAPQVVVGCVVGGMAQERQQRVLNRHPHILICTPGRLWDLVQKNEGCYLGHSISRRLRYVVLDEADKMLQSGRFEELTTLLERIHCEVLPAGFVQEREEGAVAGEISIESGRWDPETQSFVPFGKEDGTAASKRREERGEDQRPTISSAREKTNAKGVRRARDEGDAEASSLPSRKRKKARNCPDLEAEVCGEDPSKKKKKGSKEGNAETSSADKMEGNGDVEDEAAEESGVRGRKDAPQSIPMPPEPPANHRVITYVTSATLSLETNYERRDFSARKSVIRTSNADVLNKVLQQLALKPSQTHVFSLSEKATVATRINETYLRCPDNSKDLYLYYFLKTYHEDRAIVFVNAISMLRRLVKILEVLGIAVVGLHASMQQRQRLKFIDKFKRGDIRVLVATDVASRGLDIDGLKYVVHYQVPRSTDAYIHRCGRTARCGGTGLSVLLVNAQEHVSFRKLMESLGRKESEVETFAVQPTIVHQLHSHLRIALQIDKLQKEIGKTHANNQWVTRMTKEAELETDDMYDDEAETEGRQKQKAIRILQRELQLLTKKFTGQYGGKGAFRTSASALGAKQAEQKLRERADRQTIRIASKENRAKARRAKTHGGVKGNIK